MLWYLCTRAHASVACFHVTQNPCFTRQCLSSCALVKTSTVEKPVFPRLVNEEVHPTIGGAERKSGWKGEKGRGGGRAKGDGGVHTYITFIVTCEATVAYVCSMSSPERSMTRRLCSKPDSSVSSCSHCDERRSRVRWGTKWRPDDGGRITVLNRSSIWCACINCKVQLDHALFKLLVHPLACYSNHDPDQAKHTNTETNE